MDLREKKLLVLGGTSYMPYVREYADEEGFQVFCAGGTPNSVMEQFSDRFFHVEATDKKAILKLIQEEKVDGVVALGNENLIDCTIDITKTADLPFYLERKHWNELQNKQAFKRHCREFGIHVVNELFISDQQDLDKARYPLVIKPADSSGSQGVSVCKNPEEALLAFEKAKKYSRTDSVLAEEFILAPEFICSYIIHDGEPTVWMLGDRYMNRLQDGFGGISNCSVFPSKHAALYMERIHPRMVELLKEYGPRNGAFFAQGFVQNDDILFFDPALRFCGTLDIIPYTYILKINPLRWMINHSLTGIMGDEKEFKQMDWRLKGKCVVQLSLHSAIGKIEAVSGLDKILNLPGVIDVVQLLHEGDIVDAPGTLQQVLARIYIVKDCFSSALDLIHQIYDLVSIKGQDGKELLMPFQPYGFLDV